MVTLRLFGLRARCMHTFQEQRSVACFHSTTMPLSSCEHNSSYGYETQILTLIFTFFVLLLFFPFFRTFFYTFVPSFLFFFPFFNFLRIIERVNSSLTL
jgi:hypothetical protein